MGDDGGVVAANGIPCAVVTREGDMSSLVVEEVED